MVLFLSQNFSLRNRGIDKFEIKEVKFFPIDSLSTDIDKSSKEWLLAALNFKQQKSSSIVFIKKITNLVSCNYVYGCFLSVGFIGRIIVIFRSI